jgi:hypothetical protein
MRQVVLGAIQNWLLEHGNNKNSAKIGAYLKQWEIESDGSFL